MEELKLDIKNTIHSQYENFIEQYVNKEDYLYTISVAYALFAKEEPNMFRMLFMTELAGNRTIDEVTSSSWNIETIEAIIKQYNINETDAKKIYIDVRFYTHGMATQICNKSIILNEDEIRELILNAINKFIE